MANENMQGLYGWLFQYNPYDNNWQAVKDTHYFELKNNAKSPHIIKARTINLLIEVILRTGGIKSKLDKLAK